MTAQRRPCVVIADDDHVIKLARFALEGEGAVTADYVRQFFAPEQVAPERLTDLALRYGLHQSCEVRGGQSGAEDELADIVADADAVIFRRAEINAKVLDRASRLKLIQRLGARPEGIDLRAAAGRGIAVSCVPRRSLALTAEHAILLMLAAGKKLRTGDRICRSGMADLSAPGQIDDVAYNWPGLENLTGLWDATLGIVGMGEVGELVAHRARAFGMRVCYYKRTRLDPAREAYLGVEYAPFKDLLAQSDFVSVHARATPETRHLIGASALAQMKPTTILVNTSRGALIDEAALADALEAGTIAAAGLDTHEREPRAVPDRLSALDNIILTPHVAGGSRVGLIDEIEMLLRNCRAALSGEGRIAFAVEAGALAEGALK